jgi:hypothetical protein
VTNDQLGRVQLFVHLHPDWLWGDVSVFKENKFKLYFSKKLPLGIKAYYYIKHYTKLILGRASYTDSSINNK